MENGEVTFRYRDNHSQQLRRLKLTGVEFIRRFLQHTLPRGCAKVRYYGIWSPASREQLEQARTLLDAATANPVRDAVPNSPLTKQLAPTAPCPHCHLGQLFEVRVLPPQRKVPP
jgi:putative transposase